VARLAVSIGNRRPGGNHAVVQSLRDGDHMWLVGYMVPTYLEAE
jgi:hypothetical protein